MQFKIDLEDFWLEEDDNIEDALKSHIINSVTHKIIQSIQVKVDAQIAKRVNEVISEKLDKVIDDQLDKLIDAGVITYQREEISIVDHIKNLFLQSSGWSQPNTKIEKVAKAFGNELKLQYNNAFANKIVQNMKEQGLLRDDVVQILLEGS